MASKRGDSEVKGLIRPKKNVSFPETRLNVFFRQNLHSVKIGVSQAPFRLHSIVSVQRQHGKTGAQVNHVVVFFSPMYVSGPVLSEMFRYYRWLYYIHQI